MKKANTEELWTLFQKTSLEELTSRLKTAEKHEEPLLTEVNKESLGITQNTSTVVA